MTSSLQFELFHSCVEPRCERERGHADDYGHWYTVWEDGYPSYPVQWGHLQLVPCGVSA